MIELIKSGLVGIMIITGFVVVSMIIAAKPYVFGFIFFVLGIAAILIGIGTLARMIYELW